MTNKFFPFVLFLPLLFAASVTAAETIESADLTLVVEKIGETNNEGIQLVSLTDKATGHVFCSAPQRPLFSLFICAPPERKELPVLADSGWSKTAIEKKGNVLHLSWKGRTRITGGDNITVEMQIAAEPTKPGIEISQTAAAGSEKISLVNIRLGQIAVRDFGADTKLFYPTGSGVVYANPCEKNFQRSTGYPGYSVPMPWCAVWNEKRPAQGFRSTNNIGLYVGFHDVKGCRKVIECIAAGKRDNYAWNGTVSFWATIHAENMYEPNNRLNIGGKVVLRTIRNDWYDGAMIYRDWVRKEASWYPREKMNENGRTDSPQWFKEHCLWAMYRVSPEDMIPAMKKFRDAFGVPAAVHWYYWWKSNPHAKDGPNFFPYDNDYPHFFPREGFKAAVDEMQKDGDIFIMPYVNGLLWDTKDKGMEDYLYTKEGFAGAVKNADGTANLHSYGSKESDGSDVKLAHMCPAAQVWQRKVRENVLRLMNENGTKAVYVDQVAAAVPELCFDRSHGHPLGGGYWWNDGYRAIFNKIRSDLLNPDLQDHPLNDTVKKQLQSNPNALRDRVITSECTGETSLSIVDGFLTWHHQQANQIPAFAAVYGGAVQMLGRDYRAGKVYAERTVPGWKVTIEPLACRMKTAESLCFGEQIGWFVPTIIDEADKFPFQRKAVRLRHQVRHYFYKGEMCRPPDLPCELPTVTADWNFYNSPLITGPAVRTGCWKIVKNGKTQSAILLFVNMSEESITSRFSVDLSEIGLDKNNITIRQIGPEGVEKTLEPAALTQPVVFPAESVFAWEIMVK
ncbi:MAG: DUF6259 domain-containing protein [Planctomycetaceae bacterium]|nr:DUF6259 domain-containing protein [Planctomycetaceae bacterium]